MRFTRRKEECDTTQVFREIGEGLYRAAPTKLCYNGVRLDDVAMHSDDPTATNHASCMRRRHIAIVCPGFVGMLAVVPAASSGVLNGRDWIKAGIMLVGAPIFESISPTWQRVQSRANGGEND
jgi:hypothetical protein